MWQTRARRSSQGALYFMQLLNAYMSFKIICPRHLHSLTNVKINYKSRVHTNIAGEEARYITFKFNILCDMIIKVLRYLIMMFMKCNIKA
jgi:hypothetical protein